MIQEHLVQQGRQKTVLGGTGHRPRSELRAEGDLFPLVLELASKKTTRRELLEGLLLAVKAPSVSINDYIMRRCA